MRSTSKFISLILRHKPEVIGITLDEHGWADVQALIDGVNATGRHHLTQEMLEEIVRRDEKQRYAFNEDHTRIRANQGHSIPVDVELEQRTPPAVLFHGTGEKYVDAIDRQGLIPKGRLYVHLSTDFETARRVGSRHGKPVIYQVDCQRMVADGHPQVIGYLLHECLELLLAFRRIRNRQHGMFAGSSSSAWLLSCCTMPEPIM